MKKHIIAYRVLAALGVVLFLTGLVNLFYDWQLDGVQLLSVLLATGGIVCTTFASIMVDHTKIRAKTAWLIEHERKHKEAFYKPNLLPMNFGNTEEDGSKATCLPFAFINGCDVLVDESRLKRRLDDINPFPSRWMHYGPDWEEILSDYTINPAVALTDEEKDQQHLAHLIRKGEKGFNQ